MSKIKIKVSIGWSEFVMEADLATIKHLQDAKISGGTYVDNVYVPYVDDAKLKIELIDAFPVRNRKDVEAEKKAFEQARIDYDNREEEQAIAEYNAGEL